ncbi:MULTISPECIES: AAA family ATPase [Amycolatopsis]|uniref:ATPase AAA n=1 Tax=Amycolatopsis lurida NRRL 2430 TaxID=1460371 RepID=A0A2P2FVJ7_AMYLU|nr:MULTISPECIES: ATP-binding protein [Amycolatopsis]KFU80739.1 ATPase AAA [Amycolatopsis lurida NRRL 2430]QXV60142.1 AAA family ATPase [Amycolatopsis sp. TNS106]SED42941.1 AAA domain-containing protein [Amycolatopsis lurida]
MYIERVRLENIRGFSGARAVDLRLPGPGWVVLAGRNGSGKTSLLRAIAVAAAPDVAWGLLSDAGSWISNDQTSGSIELSVMREEGPAPVEVRWLDSGLLPISGLPPGQPFCAAYGPFRRLAGGSGEAESWMRGAGSLARMASLFHEDASLAEGVTWLINQHLRALEGKAGARELKDAALEILGDGLLPGGYRIRDVDSDGLWVEYRGDRFPLREMSDGYRTVTALVVDLLKQLDGAGLDHESPGVVIIDEVDAHLHVSWQKRMGSWFKAHFPRIQFIVTTHSPYVCQAADPGGLIRLSGPDEDVPPRVVSEELYERVVFGSGDDAVLSDLFGLDTPYSPQAVELREHLAELEFQVASGRADANGVREWERLRGMLSSSPPSRVDEVARRFEADDR